MEDCKEAKCRSDKLGSNGVAVFSLDFELHWGVRDRFSVEAWRKRLLGARQAIPRLLGLMNEYQISATWATVGLLFARSRKEMYAHIPDVRPDYQKENLFPYNESVGENEAEDPFHFAPSLIKKVIHTPRQEIGTHTFSHYYCLEKGQDQSSFEADLRSAIEISSSLGVRPRSIVFPRNQYNPNYIKTLSDLGIQAYRGVVEKWPYHAGKFKEVNSISRRLGRFIDTYIPAFGRYCYSGKSVTQSSSREAVNIPGSVFFRSYSERKSFAEPLRIYRVKNEIRHAAKFGKVVHLWSHPHNFGLNMSQNLSLLEEVFREIDRCRSEYGLRTMTMSKLANTLCVEADSDKACNRDSN